MNKDHCSTNKQPKDSMDSEHESEDDFTQNDDNRSDDGSERGGEMDDGKLLGRDSESHGHNLEHRAHVVGIAEQQYTPKGVRENSKHIR